MPNPDAGKPEDPVDRLAAGTSATRSRLAVLVDRFLEMVAAVFTGRSAGYLLRAMMGELPAPVITNLAISVAREFMRDLTEKQGIGTPEEQEDFRRRTQEASDHLTQAAQILDALQSELTERNQELEGLLAEIELRQADAEHWSQIASFSKQQARELTAELEQRVRTQVRAELDKGKIRRRLFAAIGWIVTLLLGGLVGAVIQQWWQTGKFSLLP